MKILIVTGGKTEDEFAVPWIREYAADFMIAADSGLSFFYRNKLKPDIILGDFDSIEPEILSYYKENGSLIMSFPPEKDATDTELALETALAKKPDEIMILGATGSRIDHLLGNIQLLSKALKQGIDCFLADAHNRVRLLDKDFSIRKEEAFGNYISLIPLTTAAEGITLKGFKYPLEGAVLTSDNSLGISNEITEEQAEISIKNGILIMVESRD